MKLAEALIQRADLQVRIEQLRNRLNQINKNIDRADVYDERFKAARDMAAIGQLYLQKGTWIPILFRVFRVFLF